jgi:ring-1,2-phenylacetyl-CoA epoxidase subunit PaaB
MVTPDRRGREFEVFLQVQEGQPHRHVGSVRAPTPELALDAAVAVFGRRDLHVSVWVVDRRDLHGREYAPLAEVQRMARTEYRRPSYFTRRLRERGFIGQGVDRDG